MTSAPADHIHISEREADGSWEDCTWDSGLEWYRLVYDARKPATHAEAQLLRRASGEPPTGGSNLEDLARGIKTRYGTTIPARIHGFTALKAALTPGHTAVVQGSMSAFGPTHRLSTYDRNFDGAHAVHVMNIGGVLLWCDPEAPTNANVPVTVSWTELEKFVRAFAGAHVVGAIKSAALPGIPGLDVSHYQANTPSLAGQKFLIAKASQGLTADAMYANHIAAADAAGIVTGAYHFNDATGTPEQQADFFLATAGDVDLLFLDVEGAEAFTTEQAKAFIARVQATGRRIGLYHSASGFFDAGQDYDWVAKWSTTPPTSWAFWQYTSSGTLAGYTGRLDLDRFNGSETLLRSLSNKEATVPLISYLPGYTADVKPESNVRSEPRIAATKLHTTTANLPVQVVGTVKGDVDPGNGSNVWYELWHEGRTEYTAKDNIINLKAPVVVPPPPAYPDLRDKVAQLEADVTAKANTINAQAASIASLKTQLAAASKAAVDAAFAKLRSLV